MQFDAHARKQWLYYYFTEQIIIFQDAAGVVTLLRKIEWAHLYNNNNNNSVAGEGERLIIVYTTKHRCGR